MDLNDLFSTYDFEKHKSDNEELVEYWKHILQSDYYKPMELIDTERYSDADIVEDMEMLRLNMEEKTNLVEELQSEDEKEGKKERITDLENQIKEDRYTSQLLNAILTVRRDLSRESYIYDENDFDSMDNSLEHVLRQVIRRHVGYNEEQVEELVELFSNQ